MEVEKVQVVQPRLRKNKTTGKVFGYWKDGTAYHIDTDMPLFQTKEVSTKFDYSPPISIHSAPDEKKQDESGACP